MRVSRVITLAYTGSSVARIANMAMVEDIEVLIVAKVVEQSQLYRNRMRSEALYCCIAAQILVFGDG